MDIPEIRYAKGSGLHVTYQVVGEGPPLVVSDQWFGNVDAQWDFPPMRRLLERLAASARLILSTSEGPAFPTPSPSGRRPPWRSGRMTCAR